MESPPPPPSILLFLLLLLLSLITPSFSQTCKTQKLNIDKLYPNCWDLPSLNSFLHWNYDSSNSSLSVAFLAAPAKPGGWVAWAINPNGTGMVGAQAIVAFRDNNSAVALMTVALNSYTGYVPGNLSFDAWDLGAEESDGLMRIFATVKTEEDAVSLNMVWQVGPSVIAGRLQKHDFRAENLKARGKLTLNGNKWKVILGVTGATIVGLFICITVCYFRCNKSWTWQGDFCLTTKSNRDIEAFLKSHGDQSIKRYKFSDIKKMANSFKDKLGQGGFGAVYKGKLLNGRLVAVKILNASKGNGEEFINEVAASVKLLMSTL